VVQICLFLLTEALLPGRVAASLACAASAFRGGPGTYALMDLDLSRYNLIAARFERERSTSNDTDRLRKYLKRFDLDWEKI
jgi:transcriptional regulatory protein RtcR